MAAAFDSQANIPEYETIGVNTKPFHVEAFRAEWLKRLHPGQYSYDQPEEEGFDRAFVKEMGIDEDTMTELKSICNIDSLRCHPKDEQPDTDLVPEDPELKTLMLSIRSFSNGSHGQIHHYMTTFFFANRQRKQKQDYKTTQKCYKNRHDFFANELERLTVERKPEAAENLIPEGDVLLTINVYYPAVCDKFIYTRPHMTLLMTGSHTLAELRDAICCVSDLQICGEFSNNPDMVPDFVSKDHYKSAFFYFEGVFYNDMRFPECRDTSATTIEWAKTRNFPTFTQGKMEDTRFVDLTVKVGFPYLYCHQGDCEHLVIITDIRLMHRSDCLDKKAYPLLVHKDRIDTQKCAVCHVYIGRWHTTNDEFAPSDPCLFCDKCFRMLHYDTEGNKLGNFLAYPYIDRGAFN